MTPAEAGLPALALADAARRALRRLTWAYGLAAIALAALLPAGAPLPWLPALPWIDELRRSGLGALALAALLIALAGLFAAGALARARHRAALPPDAELPDAELPDAEPATAGPPLPARSWAIWRRWPARPALEPALGVARAARLPQAYAVVPPALLAGLVAWRWLMAPAGAPAAPEIAFALGGAALLLAFPLLIGERLAAALPEIALPEAAGLRTLLFIPALAWATLGALRIAAGLGLPYTERLTRWLALLLLAVAAELAARALLRLFLPPPAPAAARAAVESTLARILAAGASLRGGIADPIRTHLGIDFARSWALAYVRSALPAMALLLLLLAWGLSGVALVGADQRAIYERLGAPARVLGPGAHLLLPWPLGQKRWLDYGALHAATLGAADAAAAAPVAAEAKPPPGADRLWEGAHPAEVMLLIASPRAVGGSQQAFQAMSLDVRVLWRVGMTDAQAMRAAYAAEDPATLVRATAGRAVAAFFADQTLDMVLGENREAMAERIRARIQDRLDGFASGLDVVAVVIEAIHPPAGAADAYHAVQAAEIAARASVSAERGRAQGALAAAAQTARETVNGARAQAAELAGAARADLARFTADRDAALAGGPAFPLERYFAALASALTRAPLTILDHRVAAADAPVMDIRPPSAAAPATPGVE